MVRKTTQKAPYAVRILGVDDEELHANCTMMKWTTHQYITTSVKCMNALVKAKNIPREALSQLPQEVQILHIVNKELAK